MKYPNIHEAVFLERVNRFVARVRIDGSEERVHVKNTGRCRELLIPGCTVYLVKSDSPVRSTVYDLVAVKKRLEDGSTKLVNMDSMAPNKMAAEWLASGGLGVMEKLRGEVTIGDSRFDFCAEQDGIRVVIEVKGCTLEQGGVARFPDAPTERGVKHVQGLARLAEQGCRCVVLIVIQMKGVKRFEPNWGTHPTFGHALRAAQAAGVEIVAVDCLVGAGSAEIDGFVPVELSLPDEKTDRTKIADV